MGMDHRWGIRERIKCEVVIDGDEAAPCRGHSRDVSFSGIFLSIPPVGLEPNVSVEMMVTRRVAGVTSMHRMGAVVVRVCENGVALMFTRPEVREITRFRGLFHAGDSLLTLRRPDPGRLLARRRSQEGMVSAVVPRQKIETPAAVNDPDSRQEDVLAKGANHDHAQTR
jgi:hypothetical protein